MTSPDLPDVHQVALKALLAGPKLARLLAVLNGDGEETRVIGGAVRNTLLGLPVSDIDLATTALPEEVMRRVKVAGFRPVPTGIEHGTVTVVVNGTPFEVTSLREDIETDGRRAQVRFGRDFVADALRRDFTVNALALTALGEVVDHCGGLADLAARRIRFIGEAEARIREDYLRILRFFRFQAQYGAGEPDAAGLHACIALRAGLDGLSRERVQAELMKLLAAPGRNATVASLAETGIWPHLTRGIVRTGRLAGLGDNRDPVLALAALELGTTEDATRLADILRLSNEVGRRLMAIAQALEALGNIADPVSIKTIRALAFRHGREAVADAVHVAGLRFAPERDMLMQAARSVPASPFRGADVVAAGIPAGRHVGKVIRAAEEAWVAADFPAAASDIANILKDAVRASAR